MNKSHQQAQQWIAINELAGYLGSTIPRVTDWLEWAALVIDDDDAYPPFDSDTNYRRHINALTGRSLDD